VSYHVLTSSNFAVIIEDRNIMNMKLLAVAVTLAATVGCSTISREAGQVALIESSNQLALVQHCRNIGNIDVEAGAFSRKGERRKAFVALREAAAEFGGDTVLVTATDKVFMSKYVVYGRVYDCSLSTISTSGM